MGFERDYMPPTTLEMIEGNLRDAYKQCVPGTMQHIDQLMNERRTNPELRNLWFYTANGNAYCNEGKEQVLYICREMTADGSQILNPVLKNIDDAFTQLAIKHNYRVSQVDFEAIKNDSNTVRVVLNNLSLQGNEKERRYLAISTTNYDTLNAEERKLAEHVYGQRTDFVENMKMLKDAGITKTKVYVLNPDFVKAHATESPIARASWLNSFYDNSNFNASGRIIDYNDRVRGVRREVVVAAGDAPRVVNPFDQQTVRDLGTQFSSAPQISKPALHPMLGPTRPPTGSDECPLEID